MHQHHVGLRRGLDDGACRKRGGRAGGVDEARAAGRARRGRRPAATAARRRRRGRAAPARAARWRRSAASTTSVWRPCSAKPVHRRSSITPPNATCGFETTGTKRTRACANRRRRPVRPGRADAKSVTSRSIRRGSRRSGVQRAARRSGVARARVKTG